MVMLILKNISVSIAAIMIVCVFNGMSFTSLLPWSVFWMFTIISSLSVLASVGFKTVFVRDIVVELTTREELTLLNSSMMVIERTFNILSISIGGFAITINPIFCAYAIIGVATVSVIVQTIAIFKICHIMKLSNIEEDADITNSTKTNEGILQKLNDLFNGWYLLAKSPVFVPSLVLAFLYLNVLGTGFPLQGLSRQSCITEGSEVQCVISELQKKDLK